MLEAATQLGLTHAEAILAHAEFCDYWHAEGGQKARKLDWLGTWRNRCRELARRSGRCAPAAAAPKESASQRQARLLAELEAAGKDPFDLDGEPQVSAPPAHRARQGELYGHLRPVSRPTRGGSIGANAIAAPATAGGVSGGARLVPKE